LFVFSPADLAANFPASASFAIHSIVVCHPLAQSAEHMAHQRIALLAPAIMHPFAVAPRVHQPSPLQVREMPGNFRLDYAKRISQFANAGFAFSQEIQQPQPRGISQRLEEKSWLAW
jgi:hypothetical protein